MRILREHGCRIMCIVATTLLFPLKVSACLWDRNTLESEVKGLPDVVQIVTGRFERNPPLFYSTRLERVSREIAAQPDNLALYDDAGVACDRLGRDTEAIAWMNRKRLHLPPLAQADSNAKDHWYRYYANIGTFRVHHWLAAGADAKQIHEVVEAKSEIDAALRINPNAHFGREKVQADVMGWIINPVSKRFTNDKEETALPLRSYLSYHNTLDQKGLLGLITLGNAWESYDIFAALTATFRDGHSAKIARMTILRVEELKSQGKHSLHPQATKSDEDNSYQIPASDSQEIVTQYRRLRAEAEDWQRRRTDYMLTRLKSGRHPDTDPTFWTDWHDNGPPAVHSPPTLQTVITWIIGAILILLIAFTIRRPRPRATAVPNA